MRLKINAVSPNPDITVRQTELNQNEIRPNDRPENECISPLTLLNSRPMKTSLSPDEIEEAYEYCRQVSWKHAKTFYFATHFLPSDKRRAVHGVYALCRYVDDLVDRSEEGRKSLTKDKIITLVEKWRTDIDECYDGAILEHPIMVAWYDTLQRYGIPKNLPLELIDGVCMDLKQSRYDTFDELYVYCYKVASVVGLMTSEIFGYRNEAALKHAIELGIAMQLTNILRDVGEDAQKGRLYLPKEDLARFQYSEDELFAGIMNDKFTHLMQFQIERARQFYQTSKKGISLLSPDSQMAVQISHANYGKILRQIEKNNYDVFTRRAFVSAPRKLFSVPSVWLNMKLS
jgi:15-cis-phytoene synthase